MSAAHPATEFIVALFGPHQNGRVYIASLPNIKNASEAEEKHILTRSSAQIADFTRRHDQPGEGCFFCVNPIKDKATRRAEETVILIICAHADIDFSKVEETPEEVERIIAGLSLPPSRVHHSGHGLHIYWFLKIAIAATRENNARHKRLLHQLADILGGDPAACLIPQLMRLPGTINSKNDERHEVRVLSDHTELRYELADLEQWAAATQEPLLHRKSAIGKTGNGASPDNPFLAFAAAYIDEAPLDVDQLLADMIYLGAGGGGNAHDTLLRCSAALLTRGEKREVVIERCLAALALAAVRSGLMIDPAREQTIIADMCDSWIAKHPPEDSSPADDPSTKTKKKINEQIPAEPTTAPVNLWSTFEPPHLPHGLLPSVIEDFAFEQGTAMGADPAGLAVAALAVCAAAVPDSVQLRVKRYGGWYEATRLWVGLVGDPSTKKTP